MLITSLNSLSYVQTPKLILNFNQVDKVIDIQAILGALQSLRRESDIS